MATLSIADIVQGVGDYDYYRIGMASTSKPLQVTEVLALVEKGQLVTAHGKPIQPSDVLYWIAGKHFGDETVALFVNDCSVYSRRSALALPASRLRRSLLNALDQSGATRVATWRGHPGILMTTSMPLVAAP